MLIANGGPIHYISKIINLKPSFMSEKINADLAKQVRSELSTASATIPPDYWLSIPNIYGPGTTVIVVPVAGNLWVYYGIGSA
ncbi:MAG: hypothetical protein ABW019_16510, partial [Chitinophagaceae bacterium]